MVRLAVVLIGHGAPASDCPAYLVFKLKQLEGRRRALGGEPGDEEQQLEAKIRKWPRTADNDPYRAGLEAIGSRLRDKLAEGIEVVLAYCEYCSPTLDEAAADLVERGFDRIVVVPSMMTPGGLHSDVDVPRMVDGLSWRFPDVDVDYAWPFDAGAVAALLAAHLKDKAGVEYGKTSPSEKPPEDT